MRIKCYQIVSHRSHLAGALALALVVGCAFESDGVGQRVTAITDGAETGGDPAVVALLAGGVPQCTGTLIAPRVVLTAAHCLGTIDEVRFGAEVAAPEHTALPLHVRAHPDFDPRALTDDLGVLLLDGPAPAAPVVIDDADLEGATVRLVGFGRTAAGDTAPARKHEGTAVVASAGAFTFRAIPGPSQACEGDSGGAAFLDTGNGERLVGVISAGDPACTEYTDLVRAAAYLTDFVDPFIAQTTDGAAATGERCYDDATCAAGTCRFPGDAPSIGYCTGPCGDCPGEMSCTGGTCTHPLPSPGADGAACEQAVDCDSAHCAVPEDGAAVCARPCVPGIFGCADGFTCAADRSEPGASACFPETGCGCSGNGGGDAGALLIGVALLALRRRGPALR